MLVSLRGIQVHRKKRAWEMEGDAIKMLCHPGLCLVKPCVLNSSPCEEKMVDC